MNKKEFDNEMQNKGKSINIFFSVEQLSKFYRYMELLIEWNEKINLTAIIEPEEIILKHFIDSLTILKEIKNEKKLVDIGTGAGFPGIPLSIMNENLEITLVDSLNKRLIFIEKVINELNLKKIKIIHSRAEDFGQNINYREKYDVATSRAVANLSTLSEYLIPLVKLNGKCICMKGSNADEEISSARKAINILGGKVNKIDKFNLPQTDMERAIIIIDKTRNTPNKYPRKAGIPLKNPIN